MENLKQLREAMGMTQKQIAEMLDTTQQTLARWESGKAEPSIAHLKDLAVILRTSVDELLGRGAFRRKPVVTLPSILLDEDSDADGFWGHFGVRLPNGKHTLWYPISSSVSDNVSEKLTNTHLPNNKLVIVPTLNNRVLIFDPQNVCQMELLHDNWDAPDDWNIDWDSAGMPLELYRGLEDYILYEDFSDESEASEKFLATLEDIVKNHDLSDEDIRQRTCITSIHMIDGTVVEGEGENISEIFFHADAMSELPEVLQFYSEDFGFHHFIPSKQVALIDIPLLKLTDALNEELDEMNAEVSQL